MLRCQGCALGPGDLHRLERQVQPQRLDTRIGQHLERSPGEGGERVGDHIEQQLVPGGGGEVGGRLDRHTTLPEEFGDGPARLVVRDGEPSGRGDHHLPWSGPLGVHPDHRRYDSGGGHGLDSGAVVDSVLGGDHTAAGGQGPQPVGHVRRVVDLRGQHRPAHRWELGRFRRPGNLVLDGGPVDGHHHAFQRCPTTDDDVEPGGGQIGGEHAANRPRPDHGNRLSLGNGANVHTPTLADHPHPRQLDASPTCPRPARPGPGMIRHLRTGGGSGAPRAHPRH